MYEKNIFQNFLDRYPRICEKILCSNFFKGTLLYHLFYWFISGQLRQIQKSYRFHKLHKECDFFGLSESEQITECAKLTAVPVIELIFHKDSGEIKSPILLNAI